jgi:glycine cleavage system H protein
LLVGGHEFPDGLWVQAEHQVWARFDGDGAVVGITALGIRLAGEIYMCRPKPVGSAVEQGRSIAVVELAKSIVSVKSPLSGEVIAVNPLLASRPEWVHEDPYGQGWLVRLRPSAWPAEAAKLVQGEALAAAMQQMAWLNRLDGA